MSTMVLADARLANFDAKNRVPGEYFVLFKSNNELRGLLPPQAGTGPAGLIEPSVLPTSRSSALQLGAAMAKSISAHLKRVSSWEYIGRQGMYITHATDAEIRLLAKDPRVAYIEPGLTLYPQDTEDLAPPQLIRIDQKALPPAAEFTNGTYTFDGTGSNVMIVIPDSGIGMLFGAIGGEFGVAPKVAGRVQKMVDCVVTSDCSFVAYTAGGVVNDVGGQYPLANGDCNPSFHGTNLAEIAGGTFSGVAKGVQISAAVVTYSCYVSNYQPGNTNEMAAGIDYFVAQKKASPATPFVMVISESPESIDANFDDAVLNALDAGITVVVAAGDIDGSTCGWSPADLAPNTAVISVSATYSETDQRIPGDATGKCVTLFAPGDPITVNDAGGTSYAGTGTSYSAPVVAGIAALYLQTTPTASPAQVKQEILDYSTQNVLPTTGAGAIGSGSPNLLAYEFMPAGTPPGYVPPPTLTATQEAAIVAIITLLL